MEITKELAWNPIKQDTKAGKLRHYPTPSLVNYGAMPQTWEDPAHKDADTGLEGDNDPLDVIDVGSTKCNPGEVYPVRAVGLLALVDDGEMDWKVVVVRDGTVEQDWQDASNPTASQQAKLDEIRVWFRDYKLQDGKTNEFAFDGKYLGPARAAAVIAEQHGLWRAMVSKPAPQDSKIWWHVAEL
jgi:inorganic pyrophosphatase